MTKTPKNTIDPATADSAAKTNGRRGFLKAAGAVAATGVLAACGSEGDSSSGSAAVIGETKHKLIGYALPLRTGDGRRGGSHPWPGSPRRPAFLRRPRYSPES